MALILPVCSRIHLDSGSLFLIDGFAKGEWKMRKWAILITGLTMIFLFSGLSNADLNDGLVAYYPFNGNANDESGNGYDGTIYGAELTEDRFGNPDSAFDFDGIDDKIVTPVIDGQFKTISLWFYGKSYPDSPNSLVGESILRFSSGSAHGIWNGPYSVYISDETMTISTTDQEIGQRHFTYIQDTFDEGWHHVVFVEVSTGWKIILDLKKFD